MLPRILHQLPDNFLHVNPERLYAASQTTRTAAELQASIDALGGRLSVMFELGTCHPRHPETPGRQAANVAAAAPQPAYRQRVAVRLMVRPYFPEF